MLDCRWLEDFLAIASTRSFTKAAELRSVSQSGLSRRVQSLEHWAGSALIDRNAVPLELTDAGRDLQPVATMVVNALAQVRHKTMDRAKQDRKLVRLTAPHLLSTTFFPEWLPRVSQLSDNSEIVVISQNLASCFEALDRGDVHMVVCLCDPGRTVFNRVPEPLRPDPDMIVKVGEDRLVLVSGAMEDGTPRYPSNGKAVPFLQYTPECSLAWAIEDVLAERPDLSLNRLSTNPFADGLRLMVAGGVGIAWLPESLITRDLEAGTMVRAGDESTDIPLDIVVARPSYRLSARAEKIWQGIGGDGLVEVEALPQRLRAVI